MKATVAKRGQVSITAKLRRELRLQPGQTVIWSKASASECRLVAVPQSKKNPDPRAALGFAARHGLPGGTTANWMKRLRAGEEG